MKRYFENHYPRRLKELKEDLDIISNRIERCVKSRGTDDQFNDLIVKFAHTINVFVENTKYHLKGKTADMRYFTHVSPAYLLCYFGPETLTGKIYKRLYKGEEYYDETRDRRKKYNGNGK